MSVNKYKEHALILPEDDANRQMANGFLLRANSNRVKILPEAGGWANARDTFQRDHLLSMSSLTKRHFIILIDFDGSSSRRNEVYSIVPVELRDRVFLIGVSSEPEDLKKCNFGSFEQIGLKLADECLSGQHKIWNHQLLADNSSEIMRMRKKLRSILF